MIGPRTFAEDVIELVRSKLVANESYGVEWEYGETDESVLEEMKALLAIQLASPSIHLVTAAEQAVLDACSAAFLVDGVHPRFAYDGCAETVARAELARREKKQ